MKKRGLYHLLNASFSFSDINPSGRTRKVIDYNTGNTHTIIAGFSKCRFISDWSIGIVFRGKLENRCAYVNSNNFGTDFL